LSACAKCGRQFGFLETRFDSEKIYDMYFQYNLSLDAKLPNSPYSKKHLCSKCYKEVYESLPKQPSQIKPESIQEEIKNNSNSGMIIAHNIVSNPLLLDSLNDRYVVIFDQTLAEMKFDNLNKAINIMAEKGWKCVNITSFNASGQLLSTAFYMYALMEKLC
jgi:hypothetical protein